ncbi:unnamed protein product [Vitrella brassicaformis CCMP3155]|uniref:Uncharacterized protein n=1 Tax=Vitrella brassicaformis (strain CCMP3155) TaxID=1169540 RepID=A0A0G4FAN0_VITBC|nr:unnamed protein product [Vitrella brassicaformis CCMP3155]|eukprot:CEM09677.1 unnamed protein product [Vitrella brassicaformis CCMP3155]
MTIAAKRQISIEFVIHCAASRAELLLELLAVLHTPFGHRQLSRLSLYRTSRGWVSDIPILAKWPANRLA